jgi:hypothetical protein
MTKRVTSLTLLAWCLGTALLLAFAPPARAQPVRSAISPDIEVAKFEGFNFPKRLAGLQRNWKIDYRMPGAGFSVSYGVPGETWADIYVYDRGINLPSGSELSLARKELESAIDDVHAAIRAGNYQSVVLQNRSTFGSFAKADLMVSQGGQERNSVILVTVRRGGFLKIRLTSTGDASRIAQNFAEEYNHFLTEPTPKKKRAP